MKRSVLGLLAGLAVAALALPAVAADAAMTVDLRPVLDAVITLAVGVITAVGSWAITWLVKKLQAEKGLVDERSAAALRMLMEQVVKGGIGYAEELARQYGKDRGSVQVRNQMAGLALQYAIAAAPDALGKLGMSQDAVMRMILSRMETPNDTPPDPLRPDAPAPVGSLAAAPRAQPLAPPPPVAAPAPYNPFASGL